MKNCMVVDLNSVFGTKHTDVQGAQYLLHEKRTIRKFAIKSLYRKSSIIYSVYRYTSRRNHITNLKKSQHPPQ
jgi:hypothetical protein